MFAYVQNRIPEISDELYRIDDAMKAGFGWENGPFEIWDAVGIKKGIELMKAEGHEPAAWVTEMLENGESTFTRFKMVLPIITIFPLRHNPKSPDRNRSSF
jgi:3-hydroxyacyl-CoA dehydrogenase